MKKGDTFVAPELNVVENGVSLWQHYVVFAFHKGQCQLVETKLGQLFKGDNSSKPSNEKRFLSIPTAPTLFEGLKC